MSLQIRKATLEDAQTIYDLIWELAVYEKGEQFVTNTVAQIEKEGFGENPLFHTLIAEVDGKVVGMSLYYFRYSTWKGKIFYLEDLIITQKERGKGYGNVLLEASIAQAHQEKCKGMRWQVLDWNTPAIEFYQQYPVTFDEGWLNVDWTF